MRSWLANLRSLLLPFDAGPGDSRIVIDGVDGQIVGYDDNGDVVWLLDISTFAVRGIWSVAGAASTDHADLTAVGYVRLFERHVQLNSGAQVPGTLSARTGGAGLRLESPTTSPEVSARIDVDPGSSHPRVTIAAGELELAARGFGAAGPVLDLSGTTAGNGELTFSHGASQAPSIILPILTRVTGSSIDYAWCGRIYSIGPTSATARFLRRDPSTSPASVQALANEDVDFRCLVIL